VGVPCIVGVPPIVGVPFIVGVPCIVGVPDVPGDPVPRSFISREWLLFRVFLLYGYIGQAPFLFSIILCKKVCFLD